MRVVLAAAAVLAATSAESGPRSPAERAAYVRENPCPSTGLRRGACPGWQVDHVVPLCAGGPDERTNMQWIAVDDHKWKTFVDARECRRKQ